MRVFMNINFFVFVTYLTFRYSPKLPLAIQKDPLPRARQMRKSPSPTPKAKKVVPGRKPRGAPKSAEFVDDSDDQGQVLFVVFICIVVTNDWCS